jgi:hypothetical protein
VGLFDAGEGALHRPAGTGVLAHLLACLHDDADPSPDAQVDLALLDGRLLRSPPLPQQLWFGPRSPHVGDRRRVGALEGVLLGLPEQLQDHIAPSSGRTALVVVIVVDAVHHTGRPRGQPLAGRPGARRRPAAGSAGEPGGRTRRPAYTGLFTGEALPRVLEHLELAVAAEREADQVALGATPEHLGVALQASLGMAHALDGDQDACELHMEGALLAAKRVASPFAEAYARLFAGWAAAVLDDADTAWEHAEVGVALWEVAGLSYLATLSTPVHAWAAAVRDSDPASEAARLRAAVDALAGAGHRHALAFWQLLLADVLELAGQGVGARTTIEEATALAQRIGERLDGPLVQRVAAVPLGQRASHQPSVAVAEASRSGANRRSRMRASSWGRPVRRPGSLS